MGQRAAFRLVFDLVRMALRYRSVFASGTKKRADSIRTADANTVYSPLPRTGVLGVQ